MDLQAIEARLAAATPGPWSRSGYDVGQVVYGPGGQPDLIGPISTNSDIEDAEFIAHAPKDIRALLAEVGRLSGLLDVVKKIHEKRVDPDDPDGEFCCDACRDVWGMLPFWPCPTMRALGVTEQ